MTIEEKLEKLTERHEALIQTIELMAHENRERDAKWDQRFTTVINLIERMGNGIETLSRRRVA